MSQSYIYTLIFFENVNVSGKHNPSLLNPFQLQNVQRRVRAGPDHTIQIVTLNIILNSLALSAQRSSYRCP